MAIFNEQLTTAGKTMLAEMLSSGTSIKFTKIVMGDGIAATAQIPNLTDVINPVIELDIYSVTQNASNDIIITSIFDNSMISSGFYYREKGVYATDGTKEILMMYANSGSLAEWIDPSTSTTTSVIEKRISSLISFTEADNVNIELKTGLYATEETCQEILKAIKDINFDKSDLAKEATSNSIKQVADTINEKIGAESNDSTANTLFGRIKKLIENLIKVDDKIGVETDSSTVNTIFGRLKKILENINIIDVKIDDGNDEITTLTGKVDDISKDMTTITNNTTTLINASCHCDICGKKMSFEVVQTVSDTGYQNIKEHTNEKGGFVKIGVKYLNSVDVKIRITTDDINVIEGDARDLCIVHAYSNSPTTFVPLEVPFSKKIKIEVNSTSRSTGYNLDTYTSIFIYDNQ